MSVIRAWVFVDVVETASFKDPQQAGFFMAVDPYSKECYNTHKRQENSKFCKDPRVQRGFCKTG
jgi:hypothetical protein